RNAGTHTEVYTYYWEKPFWRKVLSQTLFQRLPTLFFLQGVPPYKQNSSVFSFKGVPLAEKTELKVLGREFEGEPFFKRVSLNNTCKSSVRVPAINSAAFFTSPAP
ncbi:MAG: hypothetical protein IKP25_09910, partial [Ruminococcus sp.]|nr:hypothetical protein [Ruminococcus sp.]